MIKALLKNNVQISWQFALILLLTISLFVSRAALSLLTAAMILPAFFSTFKKAESLKILSALGLLLFPVIISFFWSNDKNEWWQAVFTKLSFVAIMIGLIHSKLTQQQIKQIVWFVSIAVFLACLWSVGNYLFHYHEINQSYLVAKVMPTLMDNDHIRLSWLIVLDMILLSNQLFQSSNQSEKKYGIGLLIFFFLYVHFLAAKTGLLSLYLTLFITTVYFFFFSNKKKYGFALLVLVMIIASTSYYIFPTLKNRIQYVVWDFKQYSNGIFLQGSSDGERVLSIRSGIGITISNPLLGVGFGDLRSEVNNWYNAHSPTTVFEERFIPQTEFLVYSAASGLIGLLVFIAGLMALAKNLFQKNLFSICVLVVLFLPLFIDDCFESQFTVVIFSFVYGLLLLTEKKLIV